MTVQQQINASTRSLGGGEYVQLTPVITEAGRAAGWIHSYPEMINKGGVNFSKLGLTLDDLLEAGYIELVEQIHTGF